MARQVPSQGLGDKGTEPQGTQPLHWTSEPWGLSLMHQVVFSGPFSAV